MNSKILLENYKNVISGVEVITPEMAKKWLLKSLKDNRDLRSGTIKRYYKDIINDKWILNGSSLVVDKDGRLIDGNHRCSAVVKANMPIVSVVVRGIDSDAYKSMDSGTNRNPSDILKTYGVKNHSKIANAVSKYVSLCNNKFIVTSYGDSNLTVGGNVGNRNMCVLEEYEKDSNLFIDIVKYGSNIDKEKHNLRIKLRLTPADISAISVYLIKNLGYAEDKVKNFFNELFEMDCATQNPYIKDYKKIMLNNFDGITKFPAKICQSYLAKTWNLYAGKITIKGKKVTLTDEEVKKGVKFA